jgi:hypothetical protein
VPLGPTTAVKPKGIGMEILLKDLKFLRLTLEICIIE